MSAYPLSSANFKLRSSLPTLFLAALIIVLGVGVAFLPVKIAGALVLGVIALSVGLLHPKIGIYLLIPAVPFSSLLQLNIGGVGIGPLEALIALILGSWLLKMLARREIIIPHPPLLWPFLIMLGVVLLSWLAMFSLNAALIETLKWVEMPAIYLFIAANMNKDDVPRLVIVLLSTGLALAIIGLYQFVFKVGPEGFLLFDGRFLRAYGTFRQPNPYAGYLGLILPLALAVTLWGVEQLRRKQAVASWLWLLLAGASFGAMVLALFASQSRGAWLGFVAAAVVTLLAKGGKWAALTAVALIAAAVLASMGALALLPPAITQRFTDILPFAGVSDVSTIAVTDANFAAIERLAHWQAAWTMWRDHLWLGVGFGNYAAIYPAYAVGRWLDPLGHAHNYILNIGAETGLIGLIGYLIFWIWIIVFLLKTLLQSSQHSFNRAVLAGSLGIIFHLHIHNLFDNLYVQGMYLHITVVFGLITLIACKLGDYSASKVTGTYFVSNLTKYH